MALQLRLSIQHAFHRVHPSPCVIRAAAARGAPFSPPLASSLHTSAPSLGGRHSGSQAPSRVKKWRAHLSEKAKKRFKKREQRESTRTAASTGKLTRATPGDNLKASVNALRVTSTPRGVDMRSVEWRDTQSRSRAVLESFTAPVTNPTSPRQALRDMDAVQALNELKSAVAARSVTRSNLNHTLRILGAHGMLQEALEALELCATRSGLEPDAGTYTGLITAAGTQRNARAAFALLEHMRASGLKLTHASVGAVMQAAVRAFDLPQAFAALRMAEEAGLPLTPVLFTHLIVGCIHEGDFNSAWEVYDHMRTHHCQPDAVTYTAMIHACARTEQPEKALGLLTEMRHAAVPVTHVTYNAIMHATARSFRAFNRTHDLFAQMAADGHAQDVYSYNAVLLACTHTGDVARARGYMAAMARARVPPDSHTLNILLCAYARACGHIHAKARATEGDALDVRSDGRALLEKAVVAAHDPRAPVRARVVSGDANALVENLLGDYYTHSKTRGDGEEATVGEESVKELEQRALPRIEELAQDITSPEYTASRDYLLREGVLTADIMREIHDTNAAYPPMDSDGERADDAMLEASERGILRAAKAQLKSTLASDAALAEQTQRTSVAAARAAALASDDSDDDITREAIARTLTGRLKYDDAVAVEAAASATALSLPASGTASLASAAQLSVRTYMAALEEDVAKVTAPGDDAAARMLSTETDDNVLIGGASLRDLLDPSKINIPASLYDSDGDISAQVLHDHVAQQLASRVASALEVETARDIGSGSDTGWSDVDEASAQLQLGARDSTDTTHTNAPADALQRLVRRRRSGLAPPVPPPALAASPAAAPSDVVPFPARGSDEYQARIRDAIAQVRAETASAAAPARTHFTARVVSRVLSQARSRMHVEDAQLVRSHESEGKYTKRLFTRTAPGMADVMAASYARMKEETVPPASKRMQALAVTHGRMYEGAHWLTSEAEAAPKSRAQLAAEGRAVYDAEFARAGVTPDIVTLNTLVLMYTNAGAGDEARRVVDVEFPRWQLQPDARTYRSLMRMHVRMRDVPACEALLETAQSANVRVDADTRGLLVHVYACTWRIKDAIAACSAARKEGVPITEKYAFLLRQRCKELGIVHPDVPAHPVGWQYTPAVMKKKRAQSRVLNKVVSYALRPKLAGGWR